MSCINIENWFMCHTSSGQMYSSHWEQAKGYTSKWEKWQRQRQTNENILCEKAIFGIKYENECARSPKLNGILLLWRASHINRAMHTHTSATHAHTSKRQKWNERRKKKKLRSSWLSLGSNLSCHISSFIIYLIGTCWSHIHRINTHWPVPCRCYGAKMLTASMVAHQRRRTHSLMTCKAFLVFFFSLRKKNFISRTLPQRSPSFPMLRRLDGGFPLIQCCDLRLDSHWINSAIEANEQYLYFEQLKQKWNAAKTLHSIGLNFIFQYLCIELYFANSPHH